MPLLTHKTKFIICFLFAGILLTQSCKKAVEDKTEDVLQQFFDQNILNRDFKVNLATDTANVLTPQYDGYIFRLLKNTNYDGPMTASKNGTVIYTGTWATNDDFSKLTISLTQPSVPVEFVFINREWRFTEKGLPIMKLAPWGNTAPKILYMERL